MAIHQDLGNFIWQIADLLRGPYRPPQYERVMLPLTVLRRFDCVLEGTKADVVAAYEGRKNQLQGDALDSVLNNVAGQKLHNHSQLTFEKLKGDPDNIDKHLMSYISGFSKDVRDIFDRFEFANEIEKMRDANILYLVVTKFCDVDLHPDVVDNMQMGLLFEDLIRRFNEVANETAGDHFTPREVIQLMVDVLFDPDDDLLGRAGTVRTMLDPACGTGGMLAEAQKHLYENHAQAQLHLFGQDFNPRAYAIAASDMLIKGHEKSRIEFGDSLTDDKFRDDKFNYFLANPPFGVDWKRQHKEILREHERDGDNNRFKAGLPRVNDGSLLFLQQMMSKFESVCPEEKRDGSRLGIVFSGSPLFTGGAGSGESKIRQWIIDEQDWLEAIIALPEQMFYNTGIGTYIWIVTNRKAEARKGKILLIDARERWKPMRRSLGDKRRYLGPDDIEAIVREYGMFVESETSKIFDNEDFGYRRVTVERPLRLRFQIDLERKARFLDACPHLLYGVQAVDERLGREPQANWNAIKDEIEFLLWSAEEKWKSAEWKLFRDVFTERDPEAAPVIAKKKSIKSGQQVSEEERFAGWFYAPETDAKHKVQYEPDSELRDFENIPLKTCVDTYFREEVLPFVRDAWMDRQKDKIGYEINFNRHFYKYEPPRSLDAIDEELETVEAEILRLLGEVTG